MNTVLFLPNWVGDIVMATPTIRALREQYHRPARLIGIVHPRVMDLMSGNPWFDQLIPYAWDAENRDHRFWSACGNIRKEHPEQAVILPHSRHHATLALLCSARKRIGYDRRQRGFLLTTRLQSPMTGRQFTPCSTLDYYLELARAAGCSSITRDMELFTSVEDDSAADTVWSDNGWKTSDRVIAINNSGAFGAAKLWPDEHVIELANRIGAAGKYRILFLCGPAEKDQAASYARQTGAAGLAQYPPGLGLTKACLRRCEMLITTDSGPRHIAAAFNKQVVTLFGPTDQAWSDTGYRRETQLAIDIECRPCQQRICPLKHHHCMRNLTVDMVWAAVHPVLDSLT